MLPFLELDSAKYNTSLHLMKYTEWIQTLFKESIHEAVAKGEDESSDFLVSLKKFYHHHQSNDTKYNDGTYHHDKTDNSHKYLIEQLEYYLYPHLIEFALMGSTVFIVMKANIGA